MITDKKSPYRMITDEQLAVLRAREDTVFNERTKKSKEAFDKAHENLLNGVPMPWMGDWGTEHPIFLERHREINVSTLTEMNMLTSVWEIQVLCLVILRKQQRKRLLSR